LHMTTNWRKDSVTCSEVESGNFTTMAYGFLLRAGRMYWKWRRLCGKITSYCARCTNKLCKFHCYCNYVFREKMFEAFLSYLC
jgi:hypothetical protein